MKKENLLDKYYIENKNDKDNIINNKTTEENKNKESEDKSMSEFVKEVSIEGMSCNHCKMSVEKAVGSIEGVTNVEVSLENKNAIVKSNVEIDEEKIKNAIEEEGFKVVDIK